MCDAETLTLTHAFLGQSGASSAEVTLNALNASESEVTNLGHHVRGSGIV